MSGINGRQDDPRASVRLWARGTTRGEKKKKQVSVREWRKSKKKRRRGRKRCGGDGRRADGEESWALMREVDGGGTRLTEVDGARRRWLDWAAASWPPPGRRTEAPAPMISATVQLFSLAERMRPPHSRLYPTPAIVAPPPLCPPTELARR